MSEKFHWVLELLGPKHDRNSFDCGEPALNHYLQQLARQHAKKNISKVLISSQFSNFTHSEIEAKVCLKKI